MKMNVKRFGMAGIAGLLLSFMSGCSTPEYTPIPPTELGSFSEPAGRNGYLIGSFLYSGNRPAVEGVSLNHEKKLGGNFRYENYAFYFRGLDKPKNQGNVVPNDLKEPTILFPEASGDIFVIPLPAGRYEFYNYSLTLANNNIGYGEWASQQDYSIPFDINADEILYVGEISLMHLFDEYNEGNAPIGGIWGASDELKRDLPLFREKCPFLRTKSFRQVDLSDQIDRHIGF